MSLRISGEEVSIPSGTVRGLRGRQDSPRGAALLLPGGVGGWATPAIYFPLLALLDLAFDVLAMESFYPARPGRSRQGEDARALLDAVRGPGELVLGGKSLGSLGVAELVLGGQLPADPATLWLTPLLDDERVTRAIEQLPRPGLFVIGTLDPLFEEARVDALREAGHTVVVLEGADHGPSVPGSAERSAELPVALVRAVKEYLG